MGGGIPDGWVHSVPVARPWWAFWRKREYVECDCSFGIFTMEGSGWIGS